MSDYIVTGEELTAVADAIRSKSGGNSQLMFPEGFVSEIGNISSGGGDGYFELLDEITVSEDTRTFNIDLSDYSSCRDLIIIENVTLSAEDWLYYVNNGTEPSGGTYDNKSLTKIGLCFAWFETVMGDRYINIKPSTTSYNITYNKIDNLYIYTYYSNTKILSGSKFQIYGKEGDAE